MLELDRETWIYLLLITVFLILFLWNSGRNKKKNRELKNRSFRKRYRERKNGQERKIR